MSFYPVDLEINHPARRYPQLDQSLNFFWPPPWIQVPENKSWAFCGMRRDGGVDFDHIYTGCWHTPLKNDGVKVSWWLDPRRENTPNPPILGFEGYQNKDTHIPEKENPPDFPMVHFSTLAWPKTSDDEGDVLNDFRQASHPAKLISFPRSADSWATNRGPATKIWPVGTRFHGFLDGFLAPIFDIAGFSGCNSGLNWSAVWSTGWFDKQNLL